MLTMLMLMLIRRAREAVLYPELTADIKKAVAGCAVCEAFQSSMIREPLMSHVVAFRPWEKIGVDISLFTIKTT